jgi:hypothetical protein
VRISTGDPCGHRRVIRADPLTPVRAVHGGREVARFRARAHARQEVAVGAAPGPRRSLTETQHGRAPGDPHERAAVCPHGRASEIRTVERQCVRTEKRQKIRTEKRQRVRPASVRRSARTASGDPHGQSSVCPHGQRKEIRTNERQCVRTASVRRSARTSVSVSARSSVSVSARSSARRSARRSVSVSARIPRRCQSGSVPSLRSSTYGT